MNRVRGFALVALAATASALAAFIVLELSPTGLSSVTNAVSQWALTPYIWGYRWMVLSLTVAGVGAAGAMFTTLARRRVSVLVWLILFAFGRSFVGWVNMDAPGSAATLRGVVHWALGVISFVSLIVAAFLTAAALKGNGPRPPSSRISLAIAWVALICVGYLLISQFVSPLASLFGLFERGFYVCALVWIGTFAIRALRHPDALRLSQRSASLVPVARR